MKRSLPPVLPQGPQHYWSEMVRLSAEGGFTITDIYKHSSNRRRKTIKCYVLHCAEQGHIRIVGERPTIKNRSANVYRVCDLASPAPIQRRGSFQNDSGRRAQQIWNTIRRLRLFTARDVAIKATTDEVQISEKRAREFISVLGKAGYCEQFDVRNGRVHWQLKPEFITGFPLAPALIKGRTAVFDRNNGKVVNLNGSAGGAA